MHSTSGYGAATYIRQDSRIELSNILQNFGQVDAGDFLIQNAATVNAESVLNTTAETMTVSGPGSLLALTNHFQNDGSVAASDQAAVSSGSFVNTGNTSLTGSSSLTTTLVNTPAGSLTVTGPGTLLTVTGVMENRGSLEITNAAAASADAFGHFSGETKLDDASLGSNGSPAEFFGGTLERFGTILGGLTVMPPGSVLPGTNIDPTQT